LAEVTQDVIAGMKPASAFTGIGDVTQTRPSESKVVASQQPLIDDGYEPLSEMPKSFAEIYDISNRNRRTKDKKRNRGGSGSLEQEEGASSVQGAIDHRSATNDKTNTSMEGCDYFVDNTTTPPDVSAEATVRTGRV
jgi:hypothetical protein